MSAAPARRAAPPAAPPARLAAAEAAFRAAVARAPRDAAAHRHLGCALAEAERFDEAIASFLAAAALAPADAANWDSLAQALAATARFAEAAAAAERAAGLAPGEAPILVRFVEYALRAPAPERAAAFARELAARHPAQSAPALAHAELLHRLGRREESLVAARATVARWPGHGPARAALGRALHESGDAAAAAAEFARARRHAPRDEALAIAHGNALRAAGDLAAAETAYAAAIAIDPKLAVAHFNRGLVRDERGDPAGAIAGYDRAVALDPGYAEARLNRAMVRLRAGRVAEAWDDYRWRETAVRAPVTARLPADLAGTTLAVRGEQGLGDQLFFLRFAALAVARGATIAVDADPRLAEILARAGFALGRPAGAVEAWMGDLPWLLGVDEKTTFPPPLALAADPARVASIAARLSSFPRPWIAVTWRAGGADAQRDTIKEIAPEAIGAALARLKGTPVSVQRAPRAGELAALGAAAGREAVDLGACNGDLEDALAAMDAVDAYVAVSNTNFHLRCGLGRASRILVPHPFDWRFAEGEAGALPWYPGQRAWRQRADGDWTPALAALAADLAAEFGR